MITVAIAASTSASAANSFQLGRSPSTRMLLNTPTTGISKVPSADTTAEARLTILNQAQ